MQRYEREIEDILRGLEAVKTPPGRQDEASNSAETERVEKEGQRLQHDAIGFAPARQPAYTADGKMVRIACGLLAAALIVLPFVSVLSGGLIVISLVVLLLWLREGRLARIADEMAARDLRWVDVTVRSRPGTSSTPRNPGD
jgi:hypothetical protein